MATVFQLAYRVLRCVQACGFDVYVLGNPGAKELRYSRHCRRFELSGCVVNGERDEALALEINCIVREWGLSMVIPGDALSTRTLIASRDLIETTCFPLPSLSTFDLLNNKWTFAKLCEQLSIRIPHAHLIPTPAALALEIESGSLHYPLIAKPLNRNGGSGHIVLGSARDQRKLSAINYQPILLQKFIEGTSISASVYARSGIVEEFVGHWYRRRVYVTFRNDQIFSDIAKIIGHLKLDGVYNFDLVTAADGSIYFLECNPRFFYRINLSMIAGINFVQCGLPGGNSVGAAPVKDGTRVRFPEALLLSPSELARCTKRDWAMAAYLYSDPLAYLVEKLRLTI